MAVPDDVLPVTGSPVTLITVRVAWGVLVRTSLMTVLTRVGVAVPVGDVTGVAVFDRLGVDVVTAVVVAGVELATGVAVAAVAVAVNVAVPVGEPLIVVGVTGVAVLDATVCVAVFAGVLLLVAVDEGTDVGVFVDVGTAVCVDVADPMGVTDPCPVTVAVPVG